MGRVAPSLFNIYLNDLFYLTESTEVCNVADDTTFLYLRGRSKLLDKKTGT